VTDQDPTARPSKPDVALRHNGARVEIYNVDVMTSAPGGSVQRVYEQGGFLTGVQQAYLNTCVRDADGDPRLQMALVLKLDPLLQPTGPLQTLRNILQKFGKSGENGYSTHGGRFGNLLSIQTASGVQFSAGFYSDDNNPRLIITNEAKHTEISDTKSDDELDVFEIRATPLSEMDAPAQLAEMGKVMADLLGVIGDKKQFDTFVERYGVVAANTSSVALRALKAVAGVATLQSLRGETYGIGENIYPAPAAEAKRVLGRTAVTQAAAKKPPEPTPETPELTNTAEVIRLEDIGGNRRLKEELRKIILSFEHPEVMQRWGARRPLGIFLYGEPGNGKTTIASAVATELGAKLQIVQSSDIYKSLLGASGTAIKKLFTDLRGIKERTVVVLNEFHTMFSITEKPGSGGADNERNAVVGIFNQEMDELAQANPNVILIATANKPDMIDASMIRPGRFDYKVHVGMPDEEARRDILSVKVSSLASRHEKDGFLMFETDLDLSELAVMADGFSGAETTEVIRRATFEAAIREVESGVPTPISQADLKRIVAEIRLEK